MKKISSSIIFIILLFIVSSYAAADLVHYVDSNGKVHYVNPDYVKIPAQYMPQVKKQLEQIRKDKMKTDAMKIIQQKANDKAEKCPLECPPCENGKKKEIQIDILNEKTLATPRVIDLNK